MPTEKTWAEQILEASRKAQQEINQSGQQTQQEILAGQDAYEASMNAAQQARADAMANARKAWEDSINQYSGGVEAIIAERQKELDRAKEVANADYMASQKAGLTSGLTHLAASLGNLIGTGFFNAPHSDYQNPAIDWMKKADQEKLVNRQRIDNMRERQRAIQQHLLDIKAQGAQQLAGFDMDAANQGYQHEAGVAGSRRDAGRDVANIGAQTRQSAIQTGLQGAQAATQADMQRAKMEQDERQFNAQMTANERRYAEQNAITLARYGLQQDPKTGAITPITDTNGNPVRVSGTGGTGASSRASGGGSTSGNNYKVTVDGQEAVIRMGTETYKSAVLRGKNQIKQDVLEEAGFDGSWEEFVEAATSGSKIKNPSGRGRIDNKYAKYSGIVSALDSDATDDDTIKDNTATIEDYINKHTETSNHFNKYLMDLANGGEIIATVKQSAAPAAATQQAEQTAAQQAQQPSQNRRVPEQPTREEIRDGRWVTVDTKTGRVIYEGGPATQEEEKALEGAAADFAAWK